jgi:hypothetical protein
MKLFTFTPKTVLALLFYLVLSVPSEAQFWSATWPFTSLTTTPATVGAVTATNATTSGTFQALSATYGENSKAWTTANTAPASTSTTYIQMTVTNASSNTEDIGSVALGVDGSSSLPVGIEIYYATNSAFTTGVTQLLVGDISTYTTYSVSGAIGTLAPGATGYFRVYFYYSDASTTIGATSFEVSGITCNNATETYTVGPTGNFPSLTVASYIYDDIALCGPTIWSLQSTYTATYSAANETFPITLDANSGASYGLTIEPASGASPSISGTSTTAILELYGASYVTINGSAGGTGTAQNLTIKNASTGTNSAVVFVANNATTGSTYNTVRNCIITGDASTKTAAGILSAGTTVTATPTHGNNNNTYQNNAVTASVNDIALVGTTAGTESGNQIIGNQCSTAEQCGIFVSYDPAIITDNTISAITSASASVSASGITAQNYITGAVISGNTIYNVSSTNSAGFAVGGIYLASTSSTSNVTVSNNYIYNIIGYGYTTVADLPFNGYGIYIYEGGGYNIYFNSISQTNNQGHAGSSGGMFIYGSVSPIPSALNIRNNIFYDDETTSTNYGIVSEATHTSFTNIDYNDYYTAGGTANNLGYISVTAGSTTGATTVTTIGGMATSFGYNTHSGAILPNFTSTTDLDLLNYNNFCLASGVAISGIYTSTDIYGDARVVPCIGADEFNYTFTSTSSGSGCSPTVTVHAPASTLAAGTYIVTYGLSSPNSSTADTAHMTYVAGTTNAGTFIVQPSLLSTAGSTTLTITGLLPITPACASNLTEIVPLPVTNVTADQATISTPGGPTAVTISDNMDPCNGGHSVDIVIAGGASPYNFTVTPTGGINSAHTYSSQTSPLEINAGGATQYTISAISDASGCVAAASAISGSPLNTTPSATLTGGNTSTPCTIAAGVTQIFYDAGGNLMGQVAAPAGGSGLGVTTFYTDALDATPQTAGTPYTQHYLQRHFHIEPATNGSATVCLFINASEASTLASNTYSGADDPTYFPQFVSNLSNAAINKYDASSMADETPQGYGGSSSERQVIPTSSLTVTANPTINGTALSNVYEICFGVRNFSGFYIASQNPNDNPLPVTLVFVNATAENNKYIRIEWATASETDNSGFEVQRSTDGNNFEDQGWIAGHLNSTTLNSYDYDDSKALPDVTYYYRLRQEDVDGNFTYSQIVSASLTSAQGFAFTSLIPNPANSEVSLGILSNINTTAKVSLIDILGREMANKEISLSIGYNTAQFDLSDMAVGSYTVIISSGAITTAKKMAITR